MKLIYSFLTLLFLTTGLSVAQTQTPNRVGTSPSSTRSSSISTTSTNRQQELYDEYHGITKKPAPATAPAAPAAPVRTEPQQQASTSTSAEPETGTSKPERVAPRSNPSGTRIGIRGGVTYPFFTESLAGIDPALAFVGGVTFNFGAGHVSFQPEINYTRYADKITSFGFTNTTAADYLEVPLFLKLSSGTYAGSRFFINIGPYAAYKLNISQDGKTTSLDGTKGRFGFGGALGVGAALKAGPGHVTVEVRGLYQLGDVDNGFNTDSKTIFGQGTLGYIFPLGGR